MKEFIMQETEEMTTFGSVWKKYDPVSELVRCKDCKHRPIQTEPPKTYGFSIEFPEGSKCPCRCCGDEWYSWYPDDEWFCAEGERN